MKISSSLDRFFSLSKKKTTIGTEIVAGLTTFVSMAYIIFLSPSVMSQSGMPYEAAIAATIYSSAICTIIMGLFSNLPIAVAPGVGLISFFSFYVCQTIGLSWQVALGAVCISGFVFLLLTVTKLRQMIIEAVPNNLRAAIVVGIGLFISFVGFQMSGIVVSSKTTMVTMGKINDPSVLLSCLGVIIIAVLFSLRVKGAILIGILSIAIIGMIFGVCKSPTSVTDVISLNFPSFSETFFQLDIVGAIKYGIVSIIFTFTVVELFDNIGTIIGVSKAAGLVDENGKIENIDKALLADSVGTVVSSTLGACTVTSYIESSTGAVAGGRTGLTSVVVGICFFLSLIFAPLAGLIPAFATAPALIIVGAMMFGTVKDMHFDDYTELVPAFLTIIAMPLTYSIANGCGFGFISYCVLKLCTGKAKNVSLIMWIVAATFVASFIMNAID